MRFLTSNTALAIPWLLSLSVLLASYPGPSGEGPGYEASVLLAFFVPWLGTSGEFFFVSDFQKEPRPQEVS